MVQCDKFDIVNFMVLQMYVAKYDKPNNDFKIKISK